MTFDLQLRSWQDLSAIVSIVALPFLFGSLLIAATQVRNHWLSSTRQASLDAFLKFSDQFQETSALRRTLASRFKNGDTSVNREDVMIYFSKYWALRQVEWEYFFMGLLPVDVYTAWIENTVRHIADTRSLSFYESGQAVELSSRAVFEAYVLDGIYKRHPACRDFHAGLRDVVRKLEDRKIAIPSDEAFEAIRRYVGGVARKRRTRRAWRLDAGGVP